MSGRGTLVSIWVKVAGKAKIRRVMKFAKIGLKLFLGIGWKVLSPKIEGFISKCWKKWQKMSPLFLYFSWKLKIYLINIMDLPTIYFWTPEVQRSAVEIAKTHFGEYQSSILSRSHHDHNWPPKVLVLGTQNIFSALTTVILQGCMIFS